MDKLLFIARINLSIEYTVPQDARKSIASLVKRIIDKNRSVDGPGDHRGDTNVANFTGLTGAPGPTGLPGPSIIGLHAPSVTTNIPNCQYIMTLGSSNSPPDFNNPASEKNIDKSDLDIDLILNNDTIMDAFIKDNEETIVRCYRITCGDPLELHEINNIDCRLTTELKFTNMSIHIPVTSMMQSKLYISRMIEIEALPRTIDIPFSMTYAAADAISDLLCKGEVIKDSIIKVTTIDDLYSFYMAFEFLDVRFVEC
jgi:hypothetical protein